MGRTRAASVEEYVAALPDDRRESFDRVLAVVRENLPEGYEEAMNWGMVCWQVPLAVYPDTYNRQPLMFCALANHKSYLSLYLVPEALAALRASGHQLRTGKSCINFKAAGDLPLAEIGEIIRGTDLAGFVAATKAAATRPPSGP
jgi:hypothetical protein